MKENKEERVKKKAWERNIIQCKWRNKGGKIVYSKLPQRKRKTLRCNKN
jgi:hypothetical protein